MGEALQRTNVPPLPRGLRSRDKDRPIPQRLRPERRLDRRSREGTRRDLPEGSRGCRQCRSQIEIWGDGEQTRSFLYIDDCVEGTIRIAESDVTEPLNLGSDELVTINQLVDLAEGFAGIQLDREYDLSAPQGVRGRNSDNSLIEKELGWAPGISLKEGLSTTYDWIADQVRESAVL